MKRSRTEQITNLVESYLHRRNYSEVTLPKILKSSRTEGLEAMVKTQTVINESSQTNLVSYGCLSVDPLGFDDQFKRLKVWCEQQNRETREELEKLVFPIFMHLCFELVIAGEVQAAAEFLKKRCHDFIQKKEYRPLIEELSLISSDAELALNPLLSPFKDNKYEAVVSLKSFELLTHFLSHQNNLILLQIVNSNIHFSLPHDEESLIDVGSHPEEAVLASIEKDESFHSFTSAVSDLREQTFLPGMRHYTVKTKPANACCGDVLPNRFLAAGLENSSIALWNLDPLAPEVFKQPDSSRLDRTCRISQQFPTTSDDTNKLDEQRTFTSLKGHASTVYNLKFTNDAKYLISCSGDTTVRLWCLNSFHNVAVYRGHTYPVWCLDLCPATGNFAVTGSADRTARLWNFERTYPLRIFAGHSQDVDCVAFHPNGSYIATGSVDKSVRLWSVSDGKLVRVFCGHKGPVLALAFSPSGQFLASAGEDRRVRVWDLAGGKLLKEFRGHSESIQSLTWIAIGNTLASSAADGTVRIWELKEDTQAGPSENEHSSPEYSCLFHTSCSSSLRLECLDNALYHIGSSY